jgi:phosphoglycerate dehydrogenase-like enzyme
MRCVILDDYQNVALAMADWGRLQGRVEIVAIDSPITDRGRLLAVLKDADIVVAMRERTRFDRALIEACPISSCW